MCISSRAAHSCLEWIDEQETEKKLQQRSKDKSSTPINARSPSLGPPDSPQQVQHEANHRQQGAPKTAVVHHSPPLPSPASLVVPNTPSVQTPKVAAERRRARLAELNSKTRTTSAASVDRHGLLTSERSAPFSLPPPGSHPILFAPTHQPRDLALPNRVGSMAIAQSRSPTASQLHPSVPPEQMKPEAQTLELPQHSTTSPSFHNSPMPHTGEQNLPVLSQEPVPAPANTGQERANSDVLAENEQLKDTIARLRKEFREELACSRSQSKIVKSERSSSRSHFPLSRCDGPSARSRSPSYRSAEHEPSPAPPRLWRKLAPPLQQQDNLALGTGVDPRPFEPAALRGASVNSDSAVNGPPDKKARLEWITEIRGSR
jgi:hypothetical protein